MPLRGRPWAAPVVCTGCRDVSGVLPEVFWRRLRSAWGALGVLWGSIFGSKSSSLQFQIEKRMQSACQVEEIRKTPCVKLNLGRSRLPTPVESARFVCRSARFAVLQFRFRGWRKWSQAFRSLPLIETGRLGAGDLELETGGLETGHWRLETGMNE